MPAWEEYKKIAKERGALAFELYVVETTPIGTPEDLQRVLPDHIAYQQTLEASGALFMAGPTSDPTGELVQGSGLIVYRAASLSEAQAFAEADPMHKENVRSFSVRKWLVNEAHADLKPGIAAGR